MFLRGIVGSKTMARVEFLEKSGHDDGLNVEALSTKAPKVWCAEIGIYIRRTPPPCNSGIIRI